MIDRTGSYSVAPALAGEVGDQGAADHFGWCDVVAGGAGGQ